MQEFEICLGSLADILEFVALAQRQPFPVFAGNHYQQVSAKSYIGMCALDCSHPIRIQVRCTGCELAPFLHAAQRFLLN